MGFGRVLFSHSIVPCDNILNVGLTHACHGAWRSCWLGYNIPVVQHIWNLFLKPFCVSGLCYLIRLSDFCFDCFDCMSGLCFVPIMLFRGCYPFSSLISAPSSSPWYICVSFTASPIPWVPTLFSSFLLVYVLSMTGLIVWERNRRNDENWRPSRFFQKES